MSKIIRQELENARTRQRAQVTEAQNRHLKAVLEYVAMMADVDIDEEDEPDE